jgi:hypothetical protein
MKKDVKITTEVLELRKEEMQLRTILIVIWEGVGRAPVTQKLDGCSISATGPATSEAVHHRLTMSVQDWVETGITNGDLLEYGLE